MTALVLHLGIHRDGSIRWVRSTPIPHHDERRQLIGYDSLIADITERKLAEEALHARENLLSSVFRTAPTGIGVVSNRVLLSVNDRVCEMIGRTQEELIGKSARILYPSDADFEYVGAEKYRQIGERGRTGTGTVKTRWQCKDGCIIDDYIKCNPLPHSVPSSLCFLWFPH